MKFLVLFIFLGIVTNNTIAQQSWQKDTETVVKDLPPIYYIDHPFTTDKSKRTVRIGICTDVHQDYFYQVLPKMQAFIDEMNAEKVDFIIQLGDFCFPKSANDIFLSVWNSFKGVKYHVIGNHDCEISSKNVFMNYVGYPSASSYYSFDCYGYHFIVLDLNFGMKNNVLIPFEANNGSVFDKDKVTYINPEQYDWLEKDLAATTKRTIIFSHQPISSGLRNPERFNQIMEKANERGMKVIAAFSGHYHQDWMTNKFFTNHFQINSMCYNYCGNSCINTDRYSSEVYAAYPVMKKMFPYVSPLYTIVEFNPVHETIEVIGKESQFVPPTPIELGFFGISSNITHRIVKY